jgi:hypothetical protein
LDTIFITGSGDGEDPSLVRYSIFMFEIADLVILCICFLLAHSLPFLFLFSSRRIVLQGTKILVTININPSKEHELRDESGVAMGMAV